MTHEERMKAIEELLDDEKREALHKKLDAELDPEFVAKHGQASWDAAMAVLGIEPDKKSE